MNQDLNERIISIEEKLNSIEEGLQLVLRGAEDVKLRKSRLEAEIRELGQLKEQLDIEMGRLRRKIEDTGILMINTSDLFKKIEEIDEKIDQMKINKLIIPFVASLIVIIVMVVLYLNIIMG